MIMSRLFPDRERVVWKTFGVRSPLQDRRRHLALIVVLVVPLYMINARWGVEGNQDALAVALPAYQVVQQGTLDLSGYEVVTENLQELDRWFVEVPGGEIVSNRAPGLIGLAIPAYAAIEQRGFSNGPATVVALLTTFAAVLVTWRVLEPLVGLSAATVASVTLALGTTTWGVSSSELWPHGPGQLWAALAILSLSLGSYLGAGAAFALSVTTRPLIGFFALFTGLLESWRRRSVTPGLAIGGITAVGVAAVLVYGRVVFHRWSLSGGYSADFTTGAVERFTPLGYLHNGWEMFLGLPNGVLVTTPILGLALIAAIAFRDEIPGWARSAAWAGVGYLLIHAALNRASGGLAIFYRYPLEAIVLAAPALTIGAHRLWQRGRPWNRVVTAAVAVSIALQFAHVFIISCWITDPVVPACLLS